MKTHVELTQKSIGNAMAVAVLLWMLISTVACNNQSPYNEQTGPVKVVKAEKPSSDTLYYKHVNTKTK